MKAEIFKVSLEDGSVYYKAKVTYSYKILFGLFTITSDNWIDSTWRTIGRLNDTSDKWNRFETFEKCQEGLNEAVSKFQKENNNSKSVKIEKL